MASFYVFCIIQKSGSDYTYNTGNGNITFDEAPASGDIISFRTFDLQQSTSATVSDTAPTNPRNGDFWFDSSTAKLYMRYEDGSSNQWVSLSVKEERSSRFRKATENQLKSGIDAFKLEGHDGLFYETQDIWSKYLRRPESL